MAAGTDRELKTFRRLRDVYVYADAAGPECAIESLVRK
jgi:hypothetical protein